MLIYFPSYFEAVLDVDKKTENKQNKDKVPPENRLHLFANYQMLSTAAQRAADNVTALPLCVCSITAADTIHCKTRIWHLHIHHLAKLRYF